MEKEDQEKRREITPKIADEQLVPRYFGLRLVVREWLRSIDMSWSCVSCPSPSFFPFNPAQPVRLHRGFLRTQASS